jgi:hypothetical protein
LRRYFAATAKLAASDTGHTSTVTVDAGAKDSYSASSDSAHYQ